MVVSGKTIASDLGKNDRFKMGGQHYLITDLDTNELGEVIIRFSPINTRVPSVNTLIVDPQTPFKITAEFD